MTTEIITREFNAATIYQRPSDGYIDATAMCKACSKRFQNYSRLEITQEFLEELSLTTQISVSRLIQIVTFDFPTYPSCCFFWKGNVNCLVRPVLRHKTAAGFDKGSHPPATNNSETGKTACNKAALS
jgi:hypothetical protein